ncbi:MAG: ROK family transcriptional regulator [Candidatus Dormibacteria bacterium]
MAFSVRAGARAVGSPRTMARTERGATQKAVRWHNLAGLLGHLHRHGPTSRAQLTKLLGLNRSTIGALVDDLIRRRLVEEAAEPERGARGRPSKVVGVRSDTFSVIAVEIGDDAVSLAAVALGGLIVGRERGTLATDADRRLDHVVDQVAELTARLLQRWQGTRVLVGMGVAVPGAVRPSDGMVRFAPSLGWREAPLAQRLHDALGFETVVRVGNDANLGALAEHSRGVASGANDLVYVHAQAGVRGGIIAGGRILEGSSGYGGEIGHMQVNPFGAACPCGSRGCWATEAGESALVRRAGLSTGGRGLVDVVLQRARDGDPTGLAAVEATARWISAGLVNLVNSLNPEMLVLGGMFGDILELAQPTILEHLRRGIYDAEQQPVVVVKPRFGREAALIGSAELALQVILDDPTAVPVGPLAESVPVGRPRRRRCLQPLAQPLRNVAWSRAGPSPSAHG